MLILLHINYVLVSKEHIYVSLLCSTCNSSICLLTQPPDVLTPPPHAGLLHVTAFQAGSCLERFGDIESLSAPPLQPLSSALDRATSANSSRVVNEAICLATPPDNPTADTENQRVVIRHVARPTTSAASTTSGTLSRAAATLRSSVEGAMQLELQSNERALMLNIYTAEVLQASSAVRRQRRRAVIRAMRAGRDTGRALLEAPAAALASCLASLDGGSGGSSV